MMGISRLQFLGGTLLFWIVGALCGVTAVKGAGDSLKACGAIGALASALAWLAGLARLRFINAGMPGRYWIYLLVPIVQIYLLLVLFFKPAKFRPQCEAEVALAEARPHRDRFVEVLSRLFLPKDDTE